jgi:hypothetical protein
MPFVRWVGDLDPADVNLPKVQADISAGKYTKEDVWAYNARRQIVLEGYSIRILGPSEGLSRSYQWGPEWGSYDVLVTDADWKRIQALPEARTFVLSTNR